TVSKNHMQVALKASQAVIIAVMTVQTVHNVQMTLKALKSLMLVVLKASLEPKAVLPRDIKAKNLLLNRVVSLLVNRLLVNRTAVNRTRKKVLSKVLKQPAASKANLQQPKAENALMLMVA